MRMIAIGHRILSIFVLLLSIVFPLFCYSSERGTESFYRALFSKEFGYTLHGVKAASLEEFEWDYQMTSNPEVMQAFLDSLKKTFKDSKNYILKVFSYENTYYTVEFINKRSLNQLILKNKKLQRFISKHFKNTSEFYEKLEDPTIKLFHVFVNDPYLIGLVLGYGHTNSQYCCRRVQVGRYLRKRPFECLFSFYKGYFFGWPWQNSLKTMRLPYKVKKPDLNSRFSSLDAEWDWMQQVEWDLDKEREAVAPYLFALPFYVCRHGGDSEMIREKFKRARVELAELFSGKSFQQTVADEAQR